MSHSVAIYGEVLEPERMKSVPYVGSPTEEVSEFPTGVWIPEVCLF
jgi:hypothetical protein